MNLEIIRDLQGVNWNDVAALYWIGMAGDEPKPARDAWDDFVRTTRAEFEGSDFVCLAQVDGRPVGAAHAVTDGARDGAIFGLVVHPEFRRQGIGTRIVRELLDDLKRVSVLLHASELSQEIFHRLGFKPLKRAMGLRYHDDDCLVSTLPRSQPWPTPDPIVTEQDVNSPVRPAHVEDIPALQWAPEWARPQERHFQEGHVFVAEDSVGKLHGILIFNRHFYGRPFIASLVVNEAQRRRGVASLLVRHVEQLWHGENIFTSTSLCNVAMQNLLAKRGFQRSGVIENLAKQSELVYFKRCGLPIET